MSKILVAYFSASGVTKKLAEKIAGIYNGDLFEIKAKVPYTNADLDWTNKNSRSSVEMKDYSSRPEIENVCENIADYDTILLGFPIWWYVAPTIVNTFLEKHNLEGKTIAPFATSGGSGMGETDKYLKVSAPNANWVTSKKFSPNASEEELKAHFKL